MLIGSKGEKYKLYFKNHEFKNTKITNEQIKNIFNEIILKGKESYKLQFELIKIRKKSKELSEKVTIIDKEISEKQNEIIKTQGYITAIDFKSNISKEIDIPYGYKISYSCDSNKLKHFILEKEYELGRWIQNENYDFVYTEYDNNVFIDNDYLKKSKIFKTIKENNFRNIKKKKVGKYNISEDFYGSVGDKNIGSVYHKLVLPLDIELTSEKYKKEIVPILKEFISIL